MTEISELQEKEDVRSGREMMAEKGVTNILEAVDKIQTRPLARLSFALGIRHIGAEMA